MELKKLVKNLTEVGFQVLVDEEVIAVYDNEGYIVYTLNTKGNYLVGLDQKEDIVSYLDLAKNYALQPAQSKKETEFLAGLEKIGMVHSLQSLWITVHTKEGKVLNVFNRTGSGLNDIDNYYQINRLFNTLTHYIQTPDEERGLEKRYWLQVHVPQTTSRISARYLVQQKHFPYIWETLTLDEIIHSKNIYNTWFTNSALEHVDETGTIRKTNVII